MESGAPPVTVHPIPDFTSIPGCIAWIETDSDGTPTNVHQCRTGKPSTVVICPIEGQRGIILVYDGELSPEHSEQVKAMIDAL